VTGASRGIGRGLAVGLGAAGASVVCAARTESEGEQPEGLSGTIHATVDAVRATGAEALAVRCDIGRAEDIEALISAANDRFGGVDVLVNNAMASTRSPFADATLEQWDESMRVNVRSLFVSCRAVVPLMDARGGGSVINISSGAADPQIRGMPPGYLTYSVAKAAMERFSTALADEVASQNVAVNALRPGAVKTESAVHELGPEWDWTGWGEPEAVVPAVVFLAAQRADGVTGRIVDSTQYGSVWP